MSNSLYLVIIIILPYHHFTAVYHADSVPTHGSKPPTASSHSTKGMNSSPSPLETRIA